MSTIQLQVLATGGESHYPIVVLITENARVLFDVGEGAQRLAVEHKVRIGKISHLCLSSHYPSSLGGVPGLLLTAFDAGVQDVQVVGSERAKRFLSSTNFFMRPFNNFAVISGQASSSIKVDGIVLDAIPLVDENAMVSHISYVGRTPDQVGKFLVEKALSLGVPKGPTFGKLKGGSPVTLADGTVVRPEDVLEPTEIGKFFAVVCAVDHAQELNMLIAHSYWNRFQQDIVGDKKEPMHIMLHLSKANVVDNPEYIQWMRSFGAHTRHIFLGQGCCHFQSSFLASNLHYSGVRKILSQAEDADYSQSTPLECGFLRNCFEKSDVYLPASALMKVTLAPERKVGHEDVLAACLASLDEVKLELEKRVQCVKNTYSNILESAKNVDDSSDFGQDQILFMGTGCAIPSKYRNVSGILYFAVSTRSGILMDVGEGTWFQLLNVRSHLNGVGKLYSLPLEVRKQKWAELIKAAWISHAHADHHLGLITVILERKKYILLGQSAFTPMLVVAPTPVLLFLADMRDHVYPELQGAYVAVSSHVYNPVQYCHACVLDREDSLGSTASHVDQLAVSDEQQAKRQRVNPVAPQDESPDTLGFARECLQQMGIAGIQAVPVIHCPQAYGLVMTRQTVDGGVKVVYSGDTRPCDELV
eukprot:gene29672-35817_t